MPTSYHAVGIHRYYQVGVRLEHEIHSDESWGKKRHHRQHERNPSAPTVSWAPGSPLKRRTCDIESMSEPDRLIRKISEEARAQLVANHRVWLQSDGTEGVRAEFDGADLSGTHLGGIFLPRASLKNTNLSGANLWSATFAEADLSGADLSGANLIGVELRGANLSNANISKAGLTGTDLSNAKLNGVTLQETDLSGAHLSGADFSNANLTKTNLNRANLSGAILTGVNLRGANLWSSNLSDSNLSKADLAGANLIGADLKQANLSGADLREANLSGADLSGADLSECVLTKAYLSDANLWSAILDRADLRIANLGRAKLWSVSLRGADLRSANLESADLWSADLTGADLCRASLLRTNLSNAILTGAIVHAVSARDVKLRDATQLDLHLTPKSDPAILVDNLEIAQFVAQLLEFASVRDLFDTVTSKLVLILGRSSDDRGPVLMTIREHVRRRGLSPVTIECTKSPQPILSGAIETLARMSRYAIVDVTEPDSLPAELGAAIPSLTSTIVQPIIAQEADVHYVGPELASHKWVLAPVVCENGEHLSATVESILETSETMAEELTGRLE